MNIQAWYNKNMKKLKSVFLLFTTALIVGGYFVYLTFSGRVESNPISKSVISAVRKYPELTGPKEISLSCSYHGKKLTVNETLYDSLNQYYKSDPEKKSAYYHDQNELMVMSYPEDDTVKELTEKINTIGIENGLNQDQTFDLAACFLQSIPYDDAKAAKILSPEYYKLPVNELVPRYPYETLYENLGICTDKSYLGAAIFRELGYATSILTFDSQRHMSIGVQVPDGYGDFGTSYGIMELTGNNFLVGDIPEISANAGLAVGGIDTVPTVTADDSPITNSGTVLSALSGVTKISDGAIYGRIVTREDIKQKILSLQPQLKSAQDKYIANRDDLTTVESQLASAEATYRANPTNATYREYLRIYNSYLSVYNTAKASVDYYNSLVNRYNSLVAQYRQY